MWYIIGKIEIAGSILGYVIANPVTKQLQAVAVNLITNYLGKINNLGVSNGNVEITDGSAPRLFYFDINLHVIQDSTPNRIYIFSESLDRKGNTYSVFTSAGFFTIDEATLKSYDGHATLVNGKFVHQDGKLIISALRGTFPKTKVQRLSTKVNPYATVTKEDKPKTEPVEKKSHIQFRKELQDAILGYSATPNVCKLMGHSNNDCLARVYHNKEVWEKTIKEPEFIYCDDTMIKIAQNSKSITQFVRSANMYLVYLQKTGKKTDLPIKYSAGRTRQIKFDKYMLPPAVKDAIARATTGGMFDAPAITHLWFYKDSLRSTTNVSYTMKDLFKELGVKPRTSYMDNETILFACDSNNDDNPRKYLWRKRPHVTKASIIGLKKSLVFYFNPDYPKTLSKKVDAKFVYVMRFWFNYIRRDIPGVISPELARFYNDIVHCLNESVTPNKILEYFNSLGGTKYTPAEFREYIKSL